jgi:hypothetical protein
MKVNKFALCAIFIVLGFIGIEPTFSQEFSVPRRYSFKTPEDYRKYEPDILKCIEYLENAPVNDLSDNRKRINSFFLEWLTGVPYVSIRINSSVTNLSNENPNLLIIFMGGWTKHSLAYPEDKSIENAYLAGIECVLDVYRKGNSIQEDNDILNLIKIQEAGKLRDWVIQQL